VLHLFKPLCCITTFVYLSTLLTFTDNQFNFHRPLTWGHILRNEAAASVYTFVLYHLLLFTLLLCWPLQITSLTSIGLWHEVTFSGMNFNGHNHCSLGHLFLHRSKFHHPSVWLAKNMNPCLQSLVLRKKTYLIFLFVLSCK